MLKSQVLADGQGNAIPFTIATVLYSVVTKRFWKKRLLQEIDPEARAKVLEACRRACLEINYRGAGTFEFLYEDGDFFFIEMNTRVQVEHPVTEMVTGVDIVKEQLRIASGPAPLDSSRKRKDQWPCVRVQVDAEDSRTFMPSPGKVSPVSMPRVALACVWTLICTLATPYRLIMTH